MEKEKKEKKPVDKQKRKDWIKGILLILMVFIIAGVILYFYGKTQRKSEEPINVSNIYDTIEKYGYTLNDNATDYYKEEFKKLKEMTDEEEIAKQVAKLFVIDLFSIDYKINKYEVTSMQYFYSDKRNMHRQKVLDNLYNLVEDNSYDDRNQSLPEVTNVEVTNSKKDKYKMGDKSVDSYVVDLSISYKENLKYDTKSEVILVKDGENNISVVSYKALKG